MDTSGGLRERVDQRLGSNTAIVDKAMARAIQAHDGQVNKHSNEPYILHPMRVWIMVRNAGLDEQHQAVAWLHDTIEDTDYTLEHMMREFGPDISAGVMSMTKVSGETNEDYYNRCNQNLIGRRVKLFDIDENFGRNHLIEDESTRARMAKKYSLGRDILCRVHL